MSCFKLSLFQNVGQEVVSDVVSFRGIDRTGAFGLLPHHELFMTVLEFGLASFTTQRGALEYIALPGGFVCFRDNELSLHAQRYWRGQDYRAMNQILQEQREQECASLYKVKSNLKRIEESIFQRLLHLEKAS